jgi:hypothetical protein
MTLALRWRKSGGMVRDGDSGAKPERIASPGDGSVVLGDLTPPIAA